MIALQDSIRSGVMSTSVADLRYFILGLSAPSGGRITVRSWDILAFVDLAPKFLEWYEDLRIVHAPHDSEHIPLRPLLATACAPSKERPSGDLQKRPLLAAQVLRSILGGGQVPAPWLQGLVERIRAEQATRRKDGKPAASNVSYFRAASIKAILNRTIRLSKSSEMEFQVALDRENTNVAYRLGRLFAAYERIQSDAAKRDLNRTIRDAYFGRL